MLEAFFIGVFMRCIVLQNDYQILGTTSWKRAISLVCSDKAEILYESKYKIHPKVFAPLVIRLIKSIRNLWKKEVPWNRANIHIRDEYTCQYCGKFIKNKKDATLDHITPRSKGGKNSWENLVTSCFECNNTKADRLPSEAKMSLIRKPWKPTIMEFVIIKVRSEGLENVLRDLKIL